MGKKKKCTKQQTEEETNNSDELYFPVALDYATTMSLVLRARNSSSVVCH